ncbi:MAG: hypothetical protein QME06_09930, partial [Desulfobacterales bacterium]|nr:hypothetical protein [Desulfobacterales bacterium]
MSKAGVGQAFQKISFAITARINYKKIMRRFFIKYSEATGPISVVSGADAKHIKKVLRLKPGDIITLFDG